MPDNKSKTLLTTKQLADRWDLQETTLERWRRLGIGPRYIRLSHRCVRYEEEAAEEYEAERTFVSTSAETVAAGE